MLEPERARNFLAGGGEMGERIRSHDWATKPVGPPENWPHSLRTLIDIMLEANQPMCTAWGAERLLFYNDPYAEVLAQKHPAALGRPFFEVWSELDEVLAPVMDRAYARETTHITDMCVVMNRRGYPEKVRLSCSFIGVPDESGLVQGVFCPLTNAVPYEQEKKAEALAEISGAKTEQALKEKELRLTLTLESAAFGEWEYDPDTRVVIASERAREIFGVGAGEVTAESWLKSIHPDDRGKVQATFAAALTGIRLYDTEYRVGDRTSFRWVRAKGRIVAGPGQSRRCIGISEDITERKQAEERLGESERQFRAVADLVPDLLWRNDREANTNWYNRRWLEYTGQTMEEAQGLGWLDAIHPDDRERSWARFLHAVETGESLLNEHRIRGTDGSYRWFLTRARPLRDDSGHVTQWFGSATDIHEQRSALERLRKSEERLRNAVDLVGISPYGWNPETCALEWDARLKAMWGLPSDAVVNEQVFFAGVHPEDRPRVEDALRQAIDPEGDGVYAAEYRVIGIEDGVERWIATRGKTTFDRGRPVDFIGAAVETTEQKRAERALQVSEARFRALAGANVIGVATWELTGRILWANDGLLATLGYTRAELEAGQLDWGRMTPVEHADATAEAISQLHQTGRFEPFEKEFIRKDGSRVLVMLGGALFPGDHEGIAFFLDLTETKRAERLIRDSLREKESLLKEVHHRVKNNLQVIVSLLNLQAGQIEQKEILAMFEETRNRVQSIAAIHEQLYRSESLAAIDLRAYAEQLGEHLERFYGFGERIRIAVNSTGTVTLPVARAVPCGLLLNELLSNALKHAYPGERSGVVSVNIREEDEGKCAIEVADTGVGLPEDIDERQSRSLGLQLVRVLARQLGSTLEISSSGAGTSVRGRFFCNDQHREDDE